MRPTLTDRATRGAIRLLGALPEPVQRLIAGKPVEVDGNRLYTEVQMALRLLNAVPGTSFEELPIDQARAQIDAEAYVFGKFGDVSRIEQIDIPTRDGSVPARVYQHRPGAPLLGTVVYFHGGGWVLGSLDSTDAVCRAIARQLDVVVVSVDYRLAPEHPFPAAVHDAVDAYRWVRQHPEWGERVAVAGDSAGGNLSAVVSLETRDEGGPDFQLLFFPATDLSTKRDSYRSFAEGYFLTDKQMDWYLARYVPDVADRSNPLASPLLAEDVSGAAPAHVAVAGFDVLRDEGKAYAARLTEAGVPTTLQVATGHIHAFTNANGVGRTGAAALREAVEHLRRGLEAARDRR